MTKIQAKTESGTLQGFSKFVKATYFMIRFEKAGREPLPLAIPQVELL